MVKKIDIDKVIADQKKESVEKEENVAQIAKSEA